MQRIRCFLLGIFVTPAFAAGQPVAQPVGVASIETLQMPGWLERDGRTQPLALGIKVRNGDKIRTGAEARVYLKLADGSTAKLGEQATLNFYSRSLKPASNFKGALDVVRGAFRFTTDRLPRMHTQRQIAIRIGTATAGIRGTDLWGKSDSRRDLIALIAGNIKVRHAGATFEMAEPMTYFAVPRNAPPEPLTRIDPETFRQWARETEILPGDGAAQRGGTWNVLLARVGQQSEALLAYDKARNAGYAAQVRVRPGGTGKPDQSEQWSYEVILAQLADEREAVVVANRIKAQLGFEAFPAK